MESLIKIIDLCNLTLVKDAKERFIILPAVSVNCCCDLNIINNNIRISLGFKLYHEQLYIANPMILLYKSENSKYISNIIIFLPYFLLIQNI